MGNIYDNIYDKIYKEFLSTQKVTRHCMTFLSSQVFLGEKSQVKSWNDTECFGLYDGNIRQLRE